MFLLTKKKELQFNSLESTPIQFWKSEVLEAVFSYFLLFRAKEQIKHHRCSPFRAASTRHLLQIQCRVTTCAGPFTPRQLGSGPSAPPPIRSSASGNRVQVLWQGGSAEQPCSLCSHLPAQATARRAALVITLCGRSCEKQPAV